MRWQGNWVESAGNWFVQLTRKAAPNWQGTWMKQRSYSTYEPYGPLEALESKWDSRTTPWTLRNDCQSKWNTEPLLRQRHGRAMTSSFSPVIVLWRGTGEASWWQYICTRPRLHSPLRPPPHLTQRGLRQRPTNAATNSCIRVGRYYGIQRFHCVREPDPVIRITCSPAHSKLATQTPTYKTADVVNALRLTRV